MANTTEQVIYRVAMQGVPAFVADAKAVARANTEVKASAALPGGAAGVPLSDAAWTSQMKARIAGMQTEAAALGARASGSAAAAESAAAGGLAGRARGGISAAAAPFGGVGALLGLGGGFLAVSQLKQGIQYASDLQRVQLDTAAAIKSTGGAANVTAPQVFALAKQIGSLAGIERNTVQASENTLLSFTKLKNGVGDGNDIFNRTSLAAANLAARLHKDLGQEALQLGKSLQAPIQGISLLRGQGVLFTNQQVDQIKVMVASGNAMGAQKIILGQIERQYAGAAKAAGQGMPGALVRLNQAWEDSRQKLMVKVLPDLTRMTNWLAETLPRATNDAGTALSIFSKGSDNIFSQWAHKAPGGSFLGAAFDYLNKQGALDDYGDLDNSLGGALPNGNTSVLDLISGRSKPAAGFKGGRYAGMQPQLSTPAKRSGGAWGDRGLGSPFQSAPVRVNWDASFDPLDNRPVILVADGKQIAAVVTKGMAKTTHAQGRGSAHR